MLGIKNSDFVPLLMGTMIEEGQPYREVPIHCQPPWHHNARYHTD